MGWSSGGEIFDPVARALVECGATDEMKRRVLGELIDRLQEGDWDTEDVSLDEFRDDPLIVQLFMERGVANSMSTANNYVTIEVDRGDWIVRCCPDFDQRRPATAEGHDELVRAFYAHDAQAHDGSGEVPDWLLINP